MIVSHTHKYVYVAIPRTASKSMDQWLVEYYDGEWYGYKETGEYRHHWWRVPEDCRDYLKFTIVRNPYEREVSSWFAKFVKEEVPTPPRDPSEFAAFRRDLYLEGDCTVVMEDHAVPEVRMNQANYVRRAGISLVLHYERLPGCLTDLPFVRPEDVDAFPRVEECGERPPGSFFDIFPDPQAEVNVWKYAKEDFAMFGYERYRTDLRMPSQPVCERGE